MQRPYYAEFGWVAASGATAQVPTPDTMWTADSDVLTPGKPVTLSWSNGQGLTFQRVVSVDEDYLFTVSQRVVNQGAEAVTDRKSVVQGKSGSVRVDFGGRRFVTQKTQHR